MKKFLFFAFLMLSLNGNCLASMNSFNTTYKGYKTSHKGNIPPEKLPEPVLTYLKKNYPEYVIMISKMKNNGNYFVKIRFSGNRYRRYYKSLVFDHEGHVIKG